MASVGGDSLDKTIVASEPPARAVRQRESRLRPFTFGPTQVPATVSRRRSTESLISFLIIPARSA